MKGGGCGGVWLDVFDWVVYFLSYYSYILVMLSLVRVRFSSVLSVFRVRLLSLLVCSG